MKLGLIGYPIQHSLSPWIHKQFMQQTEMTGTYQLYEAEQNQLAEQLSQMKAERINGFNVTVPYKQMIIPYLDELDVHAEQIGAVNTVVQRDNRWIGYNTDGLGYITALKTKYPELFSRDKRVLLLGAGGASRGIFYALCQEPFEAINIANRTLDRADELLILNHSNQIKVTTCTYEDAEKSLSQYDLIIQTTSVGMKPNVNAQVISMNNVKRGVVVSDIVYQPFLTSLLDDAKQQGARIHHGHEMLLYQAKLAFQLWSGKQVNAEKIEVAFMEQIKNVRN